MPSPAHPADGENTGGCGRPRRQFQLSEARSRCPLPTFLSSNGQGGFPQRGNGEARSLAIPYSLITYSLRVVSSTSQLPLKPGLSTKESPALTVRASPPSSAITETPE